MTAKDVEDALRIALTKRAPRSIPLSDFEKVKQRDYYTAMFDVEGEERAFLAEELLPNGVVQGQWVQYNAGPQCAELDSAALASMNMVIHQYLKQLEIRYSSPREFVWFHRLHIPFVRLKLAQLSEAVYARKLLVRADRIRVLRLLIDEELQERRSISAYALMPMLHGPRWSAHKDPMSNYHYTRMILDSFVQSADLVETDGGYRIQPKALETVVRHDLEDRRHQDNVRLQKWIVALTVAVVLVGLVQAAAGGIQGYAAYKQLDTATKVAIRH